MLKKIKFYIYVFWVLVLNLSSMYAKNTSSGAQVLEIIPDARTTALGETFCAISDDAGAIFYNPAGLANIRWIEIPVSNNQLLQGMNYQFLGIVYSLRDVRTVNIDDLGTVAISMSSLDSGDMIGRDINGIENGIFKSKDQIITCSYGKTIIKKENIGNIMAGGNIKFLSEEIRDQKSNNMCFDAGILWLHSSKKISAGISYQNFGSKLKYVTEESDLPTNLKIGTAYGILNDALKIGFDINNPLYSNLKINMGCEYYLKNAIALRLGYKSGNADNQRISTGIGLKLTEFDMFFMFAREINIDYAFVPYGDLGEMHKLTINFKIGAE